MKIIADTHAHTLASGHAYNTIREMARAAAEKGVEVLALTEHAPRLTKTLEPIYFQNLRIVPREMEGIQLLLGVELDILDQEGSVDLDQEVYQSLDITVASIHGPCYGMNHTREENTRAYMKIMENPYINIIGHPDDSRFPINFEQFVRQAKETHTLIEINNSSLRPGGFRQNTYENMLEILKLCMKYDVPVTTSSDAHVDVDAANFSYVKKILKDCEFPEELVVTTDLEKLKPFLNRYRQP